jgi:hypothetical protein
LAIAKESESHAGRLPASPTRQIQPKTEQATASKKLPQQISTQKTYPRFLCATLWITMFTSRQTRANAGFAGAAFELTSEPNRFIHEAPFYQ